MVSINNLTVQFGSKYLFKDVSFLINKTDRIGLVGKNGAGKSTLLKIIANEAKVGSGEVAYPTDFSFGYLPQELSFNDQNTVFEEAKLAFAEALKLEKRLEKINEEIAVRTDYESASYLGLLDELHELNERNTLIAGFSMESQIEKILLGLGFMRSDFHRPTSEFSGGWRMRVELAKILLKNNDLLLLDEPTNHLDIESIQWLESFIKQYRGAILLISHDKALLNNVTNRTVEISLGRIYDFKVAYSKYLEQRFEQRTQQKAAFVNQQKQIKETEDFINRFRAKASKATQVQSKIKQLNKIDRIEIEEEDNSSMNFYFPPAPRSGKVVVEVENVKKAYDDHLVFSDVNFMIERGEKIAFVGKNGAGKTTMTKIINGLEGHEGSCKLGHQALIGYFAQNQSDILDTSKSVFETIDDEAAGEIRKKVRSMLGSFLFSGDDQDKKVKVLSGGEKARLAFCKLLLEPVNFLVLDEPTNHLDIRSKEVLKQTLIKYDGTMVIISHDRDFLDGLVSKVYEFADGYVKQHIGGIYDFLATNQLNSLDDITNTSLVAEKKERVEHTSNNKVSFQEKKEIEKQIRKHTSALIKLEEEVTVLEESINTLNLQLADPATFSNHLLNELSAQTKQLESKIQQWETGQKKLEEIEAKR
jgi:ATP-binding cassette subfamily F protein 3